MSSSPPGPSTVSDADALALYDYGLYVMGKAVGPLVETAFITLYTVIFAFAIYSVFRRGIISRSSLVMLCVVIYLYATSLTLWALNVTAFFTFVHNLLKGTFAPDVSLAERLDIAHASTSSLGPPEEALFLFNMIIGDSVVIWRVWVLHQGSRWVVAIPGTLLLVSSVFAIVDVICLTDAGFTGQTSIAGGGAICEHAELVSWAISLGTNASCTLLIGLKAWQHRRMMKQAHLTRTSNRVSVDRTLSLLVESGFIYCLFWLTQVILFLPATYFNTSGYIYNVFGALGDQISGMYPTLIILIVNLHRTIWEGWERDSKTLSLGVDTGRGRSTGTTSTVRWAFPFPGDKSTVDGESARTGTEQGDNVIEIELTPKS
ncbi:hypothetical protein C8F01DRAFT_1373768 [Mycena amicta]|nr:hypothetical protein C8F01DRAFT_1373768 [Mycena amicta]